MIDYMVVKVYSKRGYPGIIKVGGWDQSALASGQSLFMLKTVDMNSWVLMANSITYADEVIVSD